MKKVTIMPGCVSCGTCQALCPSVFRVKGTAQIKEGVDLNAHADLIKDAAEICPVGAIRYDE